MLELEGYGVVTAADGVETLTRLRRDSFDALVVDVMMPHVDGLAVCRVLRADGDRTPMLLLTDRGGPRTGSPAWTPELTTICPNPSRCANCSPGCGRCCAGPS